MNGRDRDEERQRDMDIDYEWEGSNPPGDEERSRTDRGYDEAAHSGGRFGMREGRGGVFGTSGGGNYAGGFQVEDRTSPHRGDWTRDELEQLEFAPDTVEWRRGPHTGRGPRGYQRSDDRIRDDIHDRLEDDGWVDASDIGVDVRDGEVSLHGEVETRDERRRAEDVVESVGGVRHVNNSLRVRRR